MLNIKKILLPVDFPNASLNEIHQAAMLARHFGAQILMLHVVTMLSHAAGMPDAGREPAGWDLLATILQEAKKQQDLSLERELETVEFFRPPDKRETMQINLRNIITRMQPTQQDIQTLHGVIMAIAEGRKGPARGGVLDGPEAEMLRALLAEHGAGRVAKERGPVRGLARLLRRNPTEAERGLWQALVNDRRFAGRGFKRQTPVGQHICDFVSFPLRLVIDLVPRDESAAAAKPIAGILGERHRGHIV